MKHVAFIRCSREQTFIGDLRTFCEIGKVTTYNIHNVTIFFQVCENLTYFEQKWDCIEHCYLCKLHIALRLLSHWVATTIQYIIAYCGCPIRVAWMTDIIDMFCFGDHVRPRPLVAFTYIVDKGGMCLQCCSFGGLATGPLSSGCVCCSFPRSVISKGLYLGHYFVFTQTLDIGSGCCLASHVRPRIFILVIHLYLLG